MSGHTLPARVGNLTFLIERVAEDCSPLQEYRELTQNSIDAILRTPGKTGAIIWDVNWSLYDASGIFKLSITDTGDGMSGDDIRRYINNLSSSVGLQSIDANFGIGGKITAGYHNPTGVQYVSWRDGQSTMAHYWFDPVEEVYGLRQFDIGAGKFAHTPTVDRASSAEIKPECIGDHGTVVTLFGHADEINTVEAPENAPYPTHWLSRYLNRRYFEFPEGVEVQVREFSKRDPESWPTTKPTTMAQGGQLRRVNGQRHHLEQHKEHSGIVELPDTLAHWWILRDDPKVKAQLDLWQSTGHTAALYQNELYEFRDGHAGRGMLTRFGILWGTNRVVIYLEPKINTTKVTSNTARNQLRLGGMEPPWDDWGSAFQDNMPEEITKMMEAIIAQSHDEDHAGSIHERLKSLRDLFKLSRYRRTPSGDVETEGQIPGGRAAERGDVGRAGSKRPGNKGGELGRTYGSLLVSGGDPAAKTDPGINEPKVYWVSAVDGTREPGELEDRAANYLKKQHTLKINADFRVFADMIKHWEKEYAATPGAHALVERVVREWFQQQLVEAVLGAQALRGSRQWTDDDVDVCLSDEALTAVVMPRYHVYNSVKRALGTKLHSLKVA